MAEAFRRAGWYPDPDGVPGERWWNGVGWSDTRRGGAVAPLAPVRPDPYAAPPSFATLNSGGRQIARRVNGSAVAAVALGLLGVLGLSFLGPFAIIFGLVGIAKARTLRAQGQIGSSGVLATVGLIAGCVATVFFVITIAGIVAAVAA